MTERQWSQDDFAVAYGFAATAHHGQLVPGTDLPYVAHVTFVAMEVIAALREDRVPDETLVVQCALLHDVIEDTPATYEDVREAFGMAAADGVRALTKAPKSEVADPMQDSLKRTMEQPREIWMVKLADRITNLAPPPPHWTRDRRRAYRDEAGRILASLEEASQCLAQRLRMRIEDYAAHC